MTGAKSALLDGGYYFMLTTLTIPSRLERKARGNVMDKQALQIDQIQTLINVAKEAKDICRRELLDTGNVSLQSAERYRIAVMALCGDRVLASIESLLNERGAA
jgi:hypothetical protein